MSLPPLQDSDGQIQSGETYTPLRTAVIRGGPSGIQAAGEMMKSGLWKRFISIH